MAAQPKRHESARCLLKEFMGSRPCHLSFLFAVGLLVPLFYIARGQPIMGDRAYFVYMGQVVYHGEALYAATTFGYTPYGPLLAACTMHLGAALDLSTYTCPRFGGMLVSALSAMLIYLVVRSATGKWEAAMIAGLIYTGFGLASAVLAANLEPKLCIAMFTLAAARSLQLKAYLALGICCAVTAMFWQPAVIVTVAMGVIVLLQLHGRSIRWREGTHFTLGILLGVIPALIYLITETQVTEFIGQAIDRKAETHLDGLGSKPFYWLATGLLSFRSEALFLILGAVGFGTVMLKLFRKGKVQLLRYLRHSRNGGILLLTLSWAAVNSLEFQGWDDFFPILPLIAFWTTGPTHRLLKIIADQLVAERQFANGLSSSRNRPALPTLCWLLLGALLFLDSVFYTPSFRLKDQEVLIGQILPATDSTTPLVTINAEEFHAISETLSPVRYTKYGGYFDKLIEKSERGGGAGLIRRIAQISPAVFVVQRSRSKILEGMIALSASAYDHTVLRLPSESYRTLGVSLLPHYLKPPERTFHIFRKPGNLSVIDLELWKRGSQW